MSDHSKARAFAEEAKKLGWTVKKSLKGTVATVRAERGDEVLSISWDNNVYVRWATHTLEGTETRVPNAKTGIRLMSRSEAEARAAAHKVRLPVARKASRTVSPDTLVGGLPFNIDEDDETTILEAIKGKQIIWRNRLIPETSEAAYEEAVVAPDLYEWKEFPDPTDPKKKIRKEVRVNNKHLAVIRCPADGPMRDRVIHIASREGGFRCFHLHQIVRVS